MTLWQLPEQGHAAITGFAQNLDERHQRRLRELGFDIQQTIVCLRAVPFGGPRVYQVGDSVISLAKDMASAILVDRKT